MTAMINTMPEVEQLAKKLKLTGMLDKLAEQTRIAVEGKMSHLEYLAMLFQEEVLRRDNKKLVSLIKRSGLKVDKTLENFDFSFNPKIDAIEVKNLASCQFIAEKVAVLIVGPCGTGKSHLAQALGHCTARMGIDVLFTSQSKLLRELNSAQATGTYDRRKRVLSQIPLLIIDDFGLKPLSQGQDEEFHDIISERYEQTATIITSNLNFDEWLHAFPNQLLGMATLDRIRHAAYTLVLDGQSYRSPKVTPTRTKKPPSSISKKSGNK